MLTGSGAGKAIEGVSTSTSAKVSVQGRSSALSLVGAGLRYKKIAFIKPNVYVGEFFVDAPAKVQKTAAAVLGSLDGEKTLAMRMTFVRNVDGEKISNGFKEALEENKVKLDAGPVKAFLEAVKSGGEAKDKKTLIVVGEKLGAKEVVTYENAAGKAVSVEGGPGFVKEIFSMWFGKIDDSGLESFRDDVLGIKD